MRGQYGIDYFVMVMAIVLLVRMVFKKQFYSDNKEENRLDTILRILTYIAIPALILVLLRLFL